MKVVIVGNGVAGVTCAQELRKRSPDSEITLISKETPYFFSRTALIYAYMDLMTRKDLEPFERESYEKQGIKLLQDEMTDCDNTQKVITFKNNKKLAYDKLVLALGAKPQIFPWPGIEKVKEGLVHFVSMQDLDHCERLTPTTKHAVVVGGGLIGIELAECLAFHGVKVTFLVREPYFWPVAIAKEEAEFVTKEMQEHGINVCYGEEIKEIVTDSAGRVSEILTSKGNTIQAQMLGICVGVKPNIDFLKNATTAPLLGRGIIVNPQFETSLPDVFACGDCAEIHGLEGGKPLIELIWYSAKRHGALTAKNILGDKASYQPPLFFNSSKFFEIEYTTVGAVKSLPNGTPSLFGQIQKKKASLRIMHDSNKVLGFNILGGRFDHNILEQWISERRSPDYCLKNLKSAQYDVEFGRVPFEKASFQNLPLETP